MRKWIVEYVYTDYDCVEETEGYYDEVEAEDEEDAVRQVLAKFTPIEIIGVREV